MSSVSRLKLDIGGVGRHFTSGKYVAVFEDRTKTTSAAGLVKLPRLSNTMGLNGCVDAKETFEFYGTMDRVSEANCPEDRKEPEKG
tara:strand:- start:1117 stop:1374 length:258 start_codon:yes stop_codon:yes gene_type:complete